MDAGILGALIGIGVMAGGALFFYFYELYQKRKKSKDSVEKLIEKNSVVVQNPMISSSSEKTPILIRTPSHKKLKEFLPPS